MVGQPVRGGMPGDDPCPLLAVHAVLVEDLPQVADLRLDAPQGEALPAVVAARIPVLSAAAKPFPSSGSTRTFPYFRLSSRSSWIVDALVRGEVTTIVSAGAVWVQAETMHCRSQLRRWFRTGTTTVASYDTRRPFMITGASSGDRGHDQRERRPYRQHGG